MENQQMAMPAEMAAAGSGPDQMAIYEQMRQEISPQEFSNEMLASASQIDSQAVAEFTEELRSLEVSPEELDALNDLVDEILANPEQYEEIRQKYLAQGLPEDILPEQFDPNFFAAMNMAVDQMIAAPTGVQAFAQGGIAELKPIAKAIASYGRNGDTMLAHITPAEARMLRRRGGSGTINPSTGLPEFFLKKAFKSIGKAVKKFASSTVGRLVTTVALGFFLGPAAASAMGLGAGSAAAMAVQGFVGGAGSSLLAGGNLKDALKSGAIAGLTAGAAAGLSGAPLTGTGTGNLAPVVDGPASVPGAGAGAVPGAPAISATGQVAGVMPTSNPVYDFGPAPTTAATSAPVDTSFTQAMADTPAVGKPTLFEQGKDFYNKNISPSGIRAAGQEQAMTKTLAQFPNATPDQVMTAPANSALGKAFASNSPGIVGTYGPMAAVGLGTMAAFGGFDTKPVEGGDITKSLMKPADQRIREAGTQRQMYLQGLPGVVYDDMGAPVFGQSTRLPTYDVPDYNFGGFGMPGAGGQGIMNLPTTYIPPAGAVGSRAVAQPYNNANMYSNLLPRGYEDGGEVAPPPAAAATTTPPKKTPAELAAERQAMLDTMIAQQRAGRDKANQDRAIRRAGGSGQMYNNINAGLAALAPENFPGTPATLAPDRLKSIQDAYAGIAARPAGQVSDAERYQVAQRGGFAPAEIAAAYPNIGFGEVNRIMGRGALQQNYAPMLQGQQNAMAQQAAILAPQPRPMNMGGIAALAQGGYPRRTGQISGPGTEKSDDIPAMLSDGEFVMTAKAVRGAGKGSRRAGAKQMYKLMHQLEKNAERG